MNKKMLVAEGDSWFALSKITGIKYIDKDITDVINELKKMKNNGQKLYDVKSVARAGDTIGSMAYSEDQFNKFKQLLDKRPDVILLSGGGNDITGKVLEIMLNDRRSDSYSSSQNSEPLNENVVKGVINGHLREAYLKLLKKIDKLCKANFNNNSNKIPVLVHGYAHPIPDGEDFGGDYIPGLPGPWLEPAFENRGYSDLKEKTCIMKGLIDRFNCMLKNLCSKEFTKICVKHVDVKGCFEENAENTGVDYMKDYDKYWDDEFHPSECGFKLVAQKFDEVIKQTIEDQDNQNA